MNDVNEDVFGRMHQATAAPSVVTIGAFDGVHRGHQYLLGLARRSADHAGARVVAITFEPLPIQLFRPDAFAGRIVTSARRRELLYHYGADLVLELPFTHAMSQVTAEDFMAEVVAIGPVLDLWIGEDFALGHRRAGTPERLAEITGAHGTRVHAVPRIDLGGSEISSSAIRRLVEEGDAENAAALLGHRFEVTGEVVQGSQLGREIGFPTANVEPPPDMVQLKDGIYASTATIPALGLTRDAMTYIGTRPAANTGARMIETHLFDYEGDLYGQELVTSFVAHLRNDADFPSLAALQEQLAVDETLARKTLDRVRQEASNRPESLI